MTLGFAVLAIKIMKADVVINLSEHLVFLSLSELLLFDFGEFSLGLFLELVCQGHEQVLLPNAELCLGGRNLST